MRLPLVLPSLLVLASVGLAAAIAWADGVEGIEVEAESATSDFPHGVRFSLAARGPDEIDDIRVFFRKADQRSTGYGALEFQRGNRIVGDYLLRSGGGGGFIPPGTQIEYSFEVRDKAGRVYRTPVQQFVYQDNRFEWRTVSDGLITVYYYGEFAEKRARTVLEAAQGALKRMGPVLGVEPKVPLRIVAYNNYRHMVEALPFRSRVVREQLQTEGQAFAEERVLLVLGFSPTVRGITSHEFTHLLVAEAAGRGGAEVPAWLNEGLAEYANLDPTDQYVAALRYAIYTRRVKPLWYLREFGGTPDDIIIAYGQGSSVVHYLVAQYGEARIAELMRVFRQTPDIDRALNQVYGFDQYGLDSQWRTAMGLEPLPPPEQLQRRLEVSAPATPTPSSDPSATSEPEPGLVASPNAGEGPKRSPGCGAALPGRNGAATDLASLALLVGLAAAVPLRSLRRRL